MTPISDAVETYLFAASSLSPNTLISYRDKLSVFQQFCEAQSVHLEQINQVPPDFRTATTMLVFPNTLLDGPEPLLQREASMTPHNEVVQG